MHRILPACLLLPWIAPPAQAQPQYSNPSPPEALRKRFAAVQKQPPLARRADLLAAGLAETAAALDRIRTGRNELYAAALAEESQRLALLDREYEAMLAGIESTLRQAGLASQVPRLAEFTRHYRARMTALRNGIREAASGGVTPAGIARLLETVTGRSGGRPQLENTVRASRAKAPGRAVRPRRPVPASGPPADGDDRPTPADLAEDPSVQLTPLIRARAAELGNSPLRIYQHVRNTVEFEPYDFVMQNSEAVYWSGRANEPDMASYLIALLRAAGIPARYGLVPAQVPYPQVMSWLAVNNRAAADSMLNLFTDFTVSGDTVAFLHFIVEAYTETPNGKAWVALDPTFKPRWFPQAGITLPRPLFDRAAYLASGQTALASEAYLDQFRDALAKERPGAALSDAAHLGAIVPDLSGSLPASLPYPTDGATQSFSGLSSDSYHHVTIEITDPTNNKASLLKVTLNVAGLLTHTLALDFVPVPRQAGAQATIEAFGGIAGTPVFLLGSLTPRILLDGRPIATGKQAASQDWLNFHVAYYRGPSTDDELDATYQVYPGGTTALVLNAYQATDRYLGSRIDNLLNLSGLGGADSQPALNSLLPLAGLRYFNRIIEERRRIAAPLQLRFVNYMADQAMVYNYGSVKYLFDRPFLLTPERMVLDARNVDTNFQDANSDDSSAPELAGVRRAAGLTNSSLENELWEELLLVPSVSTTKLLQQARVQNAAILTITTGNSAATLAKLQLPAVVLASIKTDLAADRTIIITDRPITIGTYRGWGWISEDQSGVGSFALITANGGDSGGNPADPRPPTGEPGPTGNPTSSHGTACSDPVTVSNGNLFQTARDFLISSRGPALHLYRTYNSLSSANDGPFGFGWTHSYNMSVKEIGATVALANQTGGTFAFLPTGVFQSGPYLAPALPHLSLARDAQGYTLRQKDGLQWRFDVKGRLISLADRLNNTVRLTYDDDGRLAQVTDALNRALTFTYNTQGRVVAVQDFTGRRTSYDYDSGGNLSAVTDTAGNRTAYAYFRDATYNHLLKSMTSPSGKLTTYEYYVNRKAARTVEPGGRTVRFLYLPLSRKTVVIDGRGLATTFVYNDLGNVTRIMKPDGNFADRVYTPAAQLAAFVDEAGNATRFEYDAVGNVTSFTDPLGNRMLITYEPRFNQVTSIHEPRGAITTFDYDATGSLTRVAGPLGYENRFTYNSYGQMLTAANAEGDAIKFAYDAAGNVVQITDPLGNVSKADYDTLRRRIQYSDAAGNKYGVSYDTLSRVVRSTDSLGRTASFAYLPDGPLAQAGDFAGRTTSYSYDGLNNLSQVTDAAGNVTSYGFDVPDCGCSAAQDLVSQRTASGQTLTLSYDANDNLSQARDGAGNTTSFVYDGRASLAAKVDANGAAVAFEYDAVGRLVRKIFPDGSDARFAYDPSGNLAGASNQNVAYTFTYDELNRLKTFTDSRFDKTLAYAYDRLSRRSSLTDSEGGVFTYSWDANSRIVSIANPAGATATFAYDSLGRRTRLAYSNSTAAAYQYDAAGRMSSVTNPGLASFAYTYDEMGNPVSVTDNSGTHQLRYDQLDRLVAASHPSLPEESYRYDGAGNRLASATDSSYAYDAAGRLVSGEGFTCAWDKNGNLTQKAGSGGGTTAYGYDAENRLVSIAFPDGATVSYKYDPFGRRIEKNVNGVVTAYLYDRSSILVEFDGAGAMQARYTHGPGIDQPLMMERGGQVHFYHQDGQFNVAQLTDASGSPACSYVYDSFGRTQPCQNVANPYGFAGREYDAESGLYYMRARYYDPATGRFLSSDPLDLTARWITAQDARTRLALLPAASSALVGYAGLGALGRPQQLNSYSYALNNPGAFRDPSGLACHVYVAIGQEPWEGGAEGDPLMHGYINDFEGWLKRNDYSLSYTEGSYAAISDSSGHVVGIADASEAGFTETPYEYPMEVGPALSYAASEAGKILAGKIQASLQVPWYQLHGQEYWNAANNPENYMNRGR